MKNLIFEAFAFIEGFKTCGSVSSTKDSKQLQNIYIKNAIVSLLSLKKYNADTDIMFVTNIEIDKFHTEILKNKGID